MVMGRPLKLGPKLWFLCLILFIKHDNVIIYDAFMWSWAKSSLSDDVLFVVSCINHVLVDEIHWLSFFGRVSLGNQLCELLKCLGFIDMTLVEIQSRGRIRNIKHGLMTTRRYMQWTTPSFRTTIDCLFILIWPTMGFIMM
jgi:hypothetical protein